MTDSKHQQTLTVFAYGSNMPTSRLRERCASACSLGIAELRGYELRWHKRSTKDGSGKCDVVRSADADASVFGVLYKIGLSEKRDLDRLEGLGAGYGETSVQVLHNGQARAALAYVATDTDPTLKPYSWYHALVVAGAKEHALPESYIAMLQSVATIEDQDRTRHETNMCLIDRSLR